MPQRYDEFDVEDGDNFIARDPLLGEPDDGEGK